MGRNRSTYQTMNQPRRYPIFQLAIAVIYACSTTTKSLRKVLGGLTGEFVLRLLSGWHHGVLNIGETVALAVQRTGPGGAYEGGGSAEY